VTEAAGASDEAVVVVAVRAAAAPVRPQF